MTSRGANSLARGTISICEGRAPQQSEDPFNTHREHGLRGTMVGPIQDSSLVYGLISAKSPLKMCLERELGGTCSRLCMKQPPKPVYQLVGRLIYLWHTRPDLAYAVSVVSQYMHNPSKDHMNVVMRILRYLKSAPEKGLVFRKHGHLRTSGYTDVDWAGNITDMRFTSGYFTFVGGNLVDHLEKQETECGGPFLS
ncbi:hypothetical protein ACLB2K_046794 [Fragaria x ananassa]